MLPFPDAAAYTCYCCLLLCLLSYACLLVNLIITDLLISDALADLFFCCRLLDALLHTPEAAAYS